MEKVAEKREQDFLWKIFENTGMVGAYLMYKERNNGESGNGREAVRRNGVPRRRLFRQKP